MSRPPDVPISHGNKPLWDGDQLRANLRRYDRTPFIDLLALWMECTPSVEVIEHFAEKYPDRFVRAMVELGRLSGFADKMQVDVNLTAQIGSLSDSQLEDRLRQTAERLGISVPEILTLEYDREKEGIAEQSPPLAASRRKGPQDEP